MLQFVRIWIWISALATLAGWTLSAFGQLNRAGYGFFFGISIAVLWLLRKNFEFRPPKKFARKLFHRFCRPLPFCFAAFAVLIFISGVIYAPDNYTGLTYRAARVLQWLGHNNWQGGWFWIHTSIYRMNDRACGFEWLSAPLLLFTKSTRGLFLLNFIPFLLLPGLIFSVFTRLGVRSCVASQWMWLLPTGYIFLLQAGSIANDTFPTVYALAAMDFALRAKKTNHFSDLAFSILAAALMIGAKASNLPLLLPWAIIIVTGVKWRVTRNTKSLSLATRHLPLLVLAAVISFLPTAILNSIHCGDWSGAILEPQVMTVKNPLVGIVGNAFEFLAQNFCPPVFPFANWWNQHAPEMVPHFIAAVSEKFNNGIFHLGELPTEDWAGIGLGLSVLLVISTGAKFFHRKIFPRRRLQFEIRHLILLAPWLALLAYSAKSGMDTASRLIAPYYPLLLPLILIGDAPAQMIRARWWKILVGAHLIVAFAILILAPDRPLWPAQTILSKLAAKHPQSHLLIRAQNVYAIYAHRADPLADVRKLLPPGVKIVGFIGDADDCDISLWLPLGSRRVEHFLLSDSPETIRRSGVQYVVVGGFNLLENKMTIDDWLKKSGAELVASTTATLKVSEGPQPWFIVRLK